ncbi:MAG: LysM peptidoglycan-binding domain-containing protein [Deltaproteobacteria bacterium]|nr:LysM peptidoglycan-binding domain-containing protein [Deltaproteobacteria bacterium]
MKKLLVLILFSGLLLASGCGVAQSDYQKVISERDAMKDQAAAAQKEAAGLKEEIQALQKANKDLTDQNEKLKGEIRRARANPVRPEHDTSAASTESKAKVYEVKQGDNLLSISKKTGVPVETIKKLNNNIDSHHLKLGQKIKLSEH